MEPIARQIVIDAPPEVVWRTITEPEQISRWFADRVEIDLRPGGAGVLTFDDGCSGSTMAAALVVDTVEPPRRFAFRWCHPEGETPGPSNSMLVEFTLVAEGPERTRLSVVETGLDDVDWQQDDKVRYADEHGAGWERHLGRLGGVLTASAR
jgi:uncharacterized protein YndB with AHSA1/START domain